MSDATNPEAPEVDEGPIVDQALPDTTELDEYGEPLGDADDDDPTSPEQADDDDSAEIEHEGKKYRIAKELRDSFLMHRDYTQKTQAHAETVRTFEAEREQFRNLSNAEINAQANIIAVDAALKEYQQIDWRTWFGSDPQAAQAARLDFDELKDRRQQAVNGYGEARNQRQVQEQQETARRLQQGHAELARDIPGWTQEKAATLLSFGQTQFGFSAAEMNAISDPRMIKVLNAAFENGKAVTQRKASQHIQAQQAVKPAPKVQSGGQPIARGPADAMSTDAWLKAREKQAAKRR